MATPWSVQLPARSRCSPPNRIPSRLGLPSSGTIRGHEPGPVAAAPHPPPDGRSYFRKRGATPGLPSFPARDRHGGSRLSGRVCETRTSAESATRALLTAFVLWKPLRCQPPITASLEPVFGGNRWQSWGVALAAMMGCAKLQSHHPMCLPLGLN